LTEETRRKAGGLRRGSSFGRLFVRMIDAREKGSQEKRK
jgi:hypothetical protein